MMCAVVTEYEPLLYCKTRNVMCFLVDIWFHFLYTEYVALPYSFYCVCHPDLFKEI